MESTRFRFENIKNLISKTHLFENVTFSECEFRIVSCKLRRSEELIYYDNNCFVIHISVAIDLFGYLKLVPNSHKHLLYQYSLNILLVFSMLKLLAVTMKILT